MSSFWRLETLLVSQLELAAVDLRLAPARRERIAVDRVLAGKDRLLMKVRTDREGSMTITRVEFRGEDEWYCVMSMKDGRLSVSSACNGYFLKKVGAGDVARWLSAKAEFVEGRNFRRRLEEECELRCSCIREKE